MEPLINKTQVLITWYPVPTNRPPPLIAQDSTSELVPCRIVPDTDIVLYCPERGL